MTWKQINKDVPITDTGARLDDGRWMCVLEGPLPAHPPKPVFCNLQEGIWFDDAQGRARAKIPKGFVITHVDHVPALPTPRR